jgi:hypothetical protein
MVVRKTATVDLKMSCVIELLLMLFIKICILFTMNFHEMIMHELMWSNNAKCSYSWKTWWFSVRLSCLMEFDAIADYMYLAFVTYVNFYSRVLKNNNWLSWVRGIKPYCFLMLFILISMWILGCDTVKYVEWTTLPSMSLS